MLTFSGFSLNRGYLAPKRLIRSTDGVSSWGKGGNIFGDPPQKTSTKKIKIEPNMLPELIKSLKLTARVREMDHAYRVNGVVDIWKNMTVVYDKKMNKYYKDFPSFEELSKFAIDLISKHNPEEFDYKQEKNGMSYKDFKNQERYSTMSATVYAEDYHWKNNLEQKSEEHLYFAVVDDKVKIGRSVNVENRLKQLKTGLFKKPLVYVFNNKGFLEKKMHHIFKETRLNGEWFVYSLRIKYFIEKYHNKESGYILTPKNIGHEKV